MAHILVVDDDQQIRSLVQRLATMNGHRVDTADDGEQALDRLMVESYDLLIIDNLMPNMCGPDAVSILRTNDRYRDLKILMFSGATLTNAVEHAYEAGVDGFISKPFAADRLLHKINGALNVMH